MSSFKNEVLDMIDGLEMKPTTDLLVKLVEQIQFVKKSRDEYIPDDMGFLGRTFGKVISAVLLPDEYEEIPDQISQRMNYLEKQFDENEVDLNELEKICQKYNQNLIDNELDKLSNLSVRFAIVSLAFASLEMAILANNVAANQPGFGKLDEMKAALQKLKESAETLHNNAYEYDAILKSIRQKIENL